MSLQNFLAVFSAFDFRVFSLSLGVSTWVNTDGALKERDKGS